jgi:hemolysin III
MKKTVREQTRLEEMINALSHGVGLLMAIGALVIFIMMAYRQQLITHGIGTTIFGISLITLYFASMMYHFLPPGKWKDRFHRIDHISIYLLIAGTYTPVTLVALPVPWKWIIFGAIWGAAFMGITLKIFWFNRFKMFSLLLYALMGWMIIIAIKPLSESINSTSMAYLAAGGLFYTAGILFYMWKRLKFSHTIWHLFVLGGSMCHFFMVYHIF